MDGASPVNVPNAPDVRVKADGSVLVNSTDGTVGRVDPSPTALRMLRTPALFPKSCVG